MRDDKRVKHWLRAGGVVEMTELAEKLPHLIDEHLADLAQEPDSGITKLAEGVYRIEPGWM